MKTATATATATIWVYNENCVMAGRAVPQSKLEKYADPSDCWDWHEEELTEENAASHDGLRANQYHTRIARTIRENL